MRAAKRAKVEASEGFRELVEQHPDDLDGIAADEGRSEQARAQARETAARIRSR